MQATNDGSGEDHDEKARVRSMRQAILAVAERRNGQGRTGKGSVRTAPFLKFTRSGRETGRSIVVAAMVRAHLGQCRRCTTHFEGSTCH